MDFDFSRLRQQLRQILGPDQRLRSAPTPLAGSAVDPAGEDQAPIRTGLAVVPLSMQAATATSIKWGSDPEILLDCARLGCTTLYLPGRLDPTWWRLRESSAAPMPFSGDTDPTNSVPDLPVFPYPSTIEALYEAVGTADNIDRLVTFFLKLHDNGLRVVLNALSTFQEPRETDPALWDVQDMAHALLWNWADGHPTDDTGVAGVPSNRRYVLDPSSAYEQQALANLSAAVALLLARVQERLAEDGLDLHELVEGVAFFTLPSTRCVFPYPDSDELSSHNEAIVELGLPRTTRFQAGDYRQGATAWASLWYACASSFEACQALLGLDLPLRLPTIATYSEWEATGFQRRQSWSYLYDFWSLFLYTADYLGHHSTTWQGTMPLQRLVRAVGYQWSHRADVGDPSNPESYFSLGPRHIAHLVRDVAAFRALLESRELDARVDVLQTGISVSDPDEFVPGWAGGDQALFQAFEVWRRIGGAMASGAELASWQAWMSATGAVEEKTEVHREFYGMGQRRDTINTRTDDASTARPRPSWFAYQRLARVLDGVQSGEMLHPDLPADASWKPTEPEDELVLFHYTVRDRATLAEASSIGEPDDEHVYLALVDPTATEARVYTLGVRWKAETRSPSDWSPERLPDPDRTAVLVATTPSSTRRFSPGGPLELPEWSAGWERDELLLIDGSLATEVQVREGQVLLIRASHELRVTISGVSEVGVLPTARPRTLGAA